MNTAAPLTPPPPNAAPVKPASIAPTEPETKSGNPVLFIIFAVLLIGGAVVAGLVESGKLSLNKFFNAPKSAAIAAPPVPAPKAGTFVVTSISMGQSSFAIINGKSRVEGDPVEAPGVLGWKVSRITDDAVWLKNGSTLTALPLTMPGMKPLDDTLHPLN